MAVLHRLRVRRAGDRLDAVRVLRRDELLTELDTAELVEAGLYDPASPNAADRLTLLEELAASGCTVAEMVEAHQDGRLTGLAAEKALATSFTGLTLAEAAARVGLAPELVERAQRALGLPPLEGPAYDERTVAAFAGAAEFFGTDAALQFSRVVGSSIARVIDAAISLFGTEVAAESASEAELSRRGADATRLLLGLPETIQVLFPSYVRDAVRRLRLASAPPSSSGVRVAVGFVDLVGSTTLLQRLSGAELARAVGEFETAAYDLALSHDGRIVKFIGDEAMFVSSDPESACAIGVELCEVVADHALLDDARGAVALGDAIAQSGDYYGPTVSLVSRLTGIAAAGQLLASSTLAQELTARGAAYEFASVGAQSLRGFDEPVEAFSVHRKLG